jgi:glycosyltransferase involved in cell wall biosynthesis
MKVRIIVSLVERQGGVSTYVKGLKAHLPAFGVDVVDGDDFDVMLHVGPHEYGEVPCSGKRCVVVVHDLIPETVLGNSAVRAERMRALAAADGVIAVSNETRDAVLREYGLPPEKIRVVYHGAPEVPAADAAYERSPCGGPYLLYVGKRNEYKGFKWMLRALAPVFWLRPGLKMICTGEPFGRREKALLLLLGLWGRVRSLRIADECMGAAYANAEALVYPSRCEGFGLPVVEAMAYGCPVVVCCTSCLPEVAGDAAAYFGCGDAKGLRRCVVRFLRRRGVSEAERAAFVEKGRARARGFSWAKCARETADVLKSVCGM